MGYSVPVPAKVCLMRGCPVSKHCLISQNFTDELVRVIFIWRGQRIRFVHISRPATFHLNIKTGIVLQYTHAINMRIIVFRMQSIPAALTNSTSSRGSFVGRKSCTKSDLTNDTPS